MKVKIQNNQSEDKAKLICGLWMLLDEIDTLDDMLKPLSYSDDKLKIKSLNNFRKIALKLANKRHEIISSDGIEKLQSLLEPSVMQEINDFISK